MGTITILIFAAIGACVGAFMFFYFATRTKYLRGPTGAQGHSGEDGKDGANGVSVASTIINNAGQLVVTLTNGHTTTSESLVGQPGINGIHGKDGLHGADGTPGKDGKDGKDGLNGIHGKDGVDGVDGVNGINGVSVASAIVDNAGQLVITLTNGNINTSESLIGQPGKDGANGLAGKDGKDGAPGTDGKDGLNGKDGEAGLNGSHGKDGAPGLNFGRPLFKGNDGRDGAPGPDGKSGKDGVGITSAIVNAEGQLVIMFSDGNSYTSESIIGPRGQTGLPGHVARSETQNKADRGLRRKHLGQIDPGQGIS